MTRKQLLTTIFSAAIFLGPPVVAHARGAFSKGDPSVSRHEKQRAARAKKTPGTSRGARGHDTLAERSPRSPVRSEQDVVKRSALIFTEALANNQMDLEMLQNILRSLDMDGLQTAGSERETALQMLQNVEAVVRRRGKMSFQTYLALAEAAHHGAEQFLKIMSLDLLELTRDALKLVLAHPRYGKLEIHHIWAVRLDLDLHEEHREVLRRRLSNPDSYVLSNQPYAMMERYLLYMARSLVGLHSFDEDIQALSRAAAWAGGRARAAGFPLERQRFTSLQQELARELKLARSRRVPRQPRAFVPPPVKEVEQAGPGCTEEGGPRYDFTPPYYGFSYPPSELESEAGRSDKGIKRPATRQPTGPRTLAAAFRE